MKLHHRRLVMIVSFISACLFSNALGRSQWADKTYQKWDLGDIEKLLNDSPWAQTKSKGAALGYDNPILTSGNIAAPESVTLRLRSALPIRQAILRLRQIKAKYEKMSDTEKQAFDSKQKDLL